MKGVLDSGMRPRRLWRACALAAFALLLGAAPAAAEPPDRTEGITPPTDGWTGTLALGINTGYDSANPDACGDDPENYCETVLMDVDSQGIWDTQGGVLELTLDNYTVPASDFDLYVFQSDAIGTRGALIDSSGGPPGSTETVEIPEADGFYLVEVVYFAVPSSAYDATATFVTRPDPAPVPPDVDSPPGFEDNLASDPSLGFRSHSEPHIAQSPTNPNLLIAASKMYNRDPDSLPEYEFKVGTYISFDGGRSWTDLGQTNVCPPEQAPPSSWPDNTCYPDEDPNAEGTGAEDSSTPPRKIDVVPRKIQRDIRERGGRGVRQFGSVTVEPGETRGTDYGEEYITSDPWVNFDDEGNAYFMLLDSPPYDHGNGWGMSFHRWETPSPQDVANDDTWSDRIPINAYSQDIAEFFLDDKNTFAINNAGPDGDGETGPMVACWGQNIPGAIKQQTVCERSTDAGRSWPGAPIPISSAQQLVIGVSVVADNEDPNTFYATWLSYANSLAGLPSEYWFARSLDGGQTWTPQQLVTQVNDIPTQFPGRQFRNLSIPIMAAGPNSGELYTTYAEYLPPTSAAPGDFDQMQADIRLVKSTNGGLTWSMPETVNVDPPANHAPDQFQPVPAVTPEGQLNIAYFDSRHDPDNFHIDTYLARSNDGGDTFTETRVSHDAWDPRINPPISGAGHFIGDYQGLVADSCNAIPFFNDTHLANDPGRDPDFDDGDPRSPFQEVFSWRVPNTAPFGGDPVSGVDCTAAAPGPDFDGDGVPDAQDQCPNAAGPPSNNGCPVSAGGAGAQQSQTACANEIAGTSGRDRLVGTAAGDRMLGRRGRDRLSGEAGADCLFGGKGKDRLIGGPGQDQLRGGNGPDKINSRDGEVDQVNCGTGRDRAKADDSDALRGCEL